MFLAALALAVALSAGTARARVADWSEAGSSVLDWYMVALDRRAAGDVDGAVEALEAARLLAPDDADLALEVARAYAGARRYGAAAAAYAEAGVLAPQRGDLALEQARFHLAHGFRPWVAAEAAERAALLAPADEEARKLLDRARTLAALIRR